jgi:hypothetical protein
MVLINNLYHYFNSYCTSSKLLSFFSPKQYCITQFHSLSTFVNLSAKLDVMNIIVRLIVQFIKPSIDPGRKFLVTFADPSQWTNIAQAQKTSPSVPCLPTIGTHYTCIQIPRKRKSFSNSNIISPPTK